MNDTLPDLRVTIAESMEALAYAKLDQTRINDRGDLHGESTRCLRSLRSAETLRWCAQRSAPSIEELQAEIERLEDVLDLVYDAIDAAGQTMAQRMARIREAIA